MRGFLLIFGCLTVGATAVTKTLVETSGDLAISDYLIFAGLVAVAALIAALPSVIERINEFRAQARSFVAALAMAAMAFYTLDFTEHMAFVASAGNNADTQATQGVSSSSLPRQADGHFRAVANIDGKTVPFLVDTGASIVLLTYEHAQAAGLDMDNLTFDLPILTANGRGHVASVTLPQIRVGDVVVNNVRAAVASEGQLHASLLGMSFLGEINEAIIRKNEMILRN